MRILTDLFDNSDRTETLLVLLPPAEARIEDFYVYGFVEAIRLRNIKIDLILAEATYQDIMNGTVVSALHKQVVQPAKAAGYKKIWFTGISLGAFNTMYYISEYAGDIAGVHLISPYPGTRDVLAEIADAGGPAKWASTISVDKKDERAWWYWLCQEEASGKWETPIYFGTGSSDRFLQGQRMVANLLPRENVTILDGSHDWPTWQALWHDWLDHGPLACIDHAIEN